MINLFCGIDVGTRSSVICLITEEKQIFEEMKVKTSDIYEVLSELA